MFDIKCAPPPHAAPPCLCSGAQTTYTHSRKGGTTAHRNIRMTISPASAYCHDIMLIMTSCSSVADLQHSGFLSCSLALCGLAVGQERRPAADYLALASQTPRPP